MECVWKSNTIKREQSEYETEWEPSWITLLLRMRISYQLHLLLFLLSREWKWRDTSFRVFPLGLDPIPQRTSQIDIQPCLSVTHTGGSDTNTSFHTASIRFPSPKITRHNKSETKWKTRHRHWTSHCYIISWLHAWRKPLVKWFPWTWQHLSTG